MCYWIDRMRYIVLLLVLVLVSCSHDSEDAIGVPSGQGGVLNVYVYPSDNPMVTRSDIGPVSVDNLERDVKSLKIWIFKHNEAAGTDLPLHYLAPAEPELQGSRAQLFQIALTETQVEALTGAANLVDVYVLANAASVGLNGLNGTSTRAAVREALIGSNYFGTSSPTTDIGTNGLPMSGCAEGISVQGSLPVLSLPVVKLTRCVSKLRFVLVQSDESDMGLSLTGIHLNGNQFPETEHVFNTTSNPYSVSATYVANGISFAPPSDIAKSDRISDLLYTSQSAQDYEDLVDAFVARGEATQMGPYYFRESDRCLAGSIDYSITDTEHQVTYKTANFSMNDVPGTYNFSRNHTWIVYVYYYGGELLQLNLAYITQWSVEDREHELYNW